MATPFETVIIRLQELGMFQFFFPFMLSSAIFYGLLRKSKIFGDPRQNIAVNAIVSLVAAFMIWAYPILAGVSIEYQLSTFFTQGMLAMLATMVGLMVIGMFLPPGVAERIKEIGFGKKFYGGLIVIFVLVGFGILISSGLWNVFFPSGIDLGFEMSSDILITVGIILLLVITVGVIVFGGGA